MQSLDEGARLEFLIVAQEQEPAQRLAEMLRGIPTTPSNTPVVSIALGASRVFAVGNADVVFVNADRSTTAWADVVRRLVHDAPTTPVVAVLQHHDDGMCADAMGAGASACLSLEPVDRDRLRATISCAMMLRRVASEHERAQASLREESDRRRAACAAMEELACIGTWSWDVVARRGTWSDGMFRLFDLEPRDTMPEFDDFLAFVHLDDRNAVREAWRAIHRGAHAGNDRLTYRIILPSGETRTMHATWHASSFVPNGGAATIIGVVQDVTDREAAVDSLRRDESMYRNAVGHAPIGVGTLGSDGRWLRVNRVLSEMLGYSEPELLQRTIRDVTHPEDAATDGETLSRLFAGELPFFDGEKRFIHKGGHVVWAQVSTTIVHDERRPPYAVIHLQDVTERHRAREASEFIAEAGHVLASSLDSEEIVRTIAHLAVPRLGDWCTIDLLDSTTGELNAAEVVAISAEKEEVLRQMRTRYPVEPFSFDHPVSRVIRTGQATLVSAVRPELLSRMARDTDHLQLLRRLAPVSWMIVPLAARGRIIGAITLAASESRRHYGLDDLRVAEELATSSALAIDNARLFDEARASARLRDDVLGFVTHDLRNPLAAIVRWSSRLDDGDLGTEERRRATTAIRDAADVMNSLITDLLDLTRLESGHLRIEPEPVRPEYLLSGIREMFEPTARSKGVELRVEISDLPRVHADPQRIHQVLSNLVGNSMRFVTSGGSIVVRAQAHHDEVLFSVQDTGPGIAPDDVSKVFDRFWQAAHARKSGAGLGLAIARGIIEAHKGRIWVESVLRRGSTFFFTLPMWHGAVAETASSVNTETHPTRVTPERALPERATPERTTPERATRERGTPERATPEQPVAATVESLRVLVVEDHPLTRSGLVQLLGDQPGIQVVGEASTGEQAVEMVPKLHPDVVIMDLSMPGIGGVEATRRIVAQASDAVILVLTADEAPTTLAEALRAGARGYLRKTINERDLVNSLRVVARGEVLIDPALKEFLRTGLRAPAEEAALAGLNELSERERKVLALAAQGYTAAQAGERLFLSPKTVETYRSRAMRKLGLETRADLVAFALRNGLLAS